VSMPPPIPAVDSTITPRELRELLSSGNPVAWIDVREPVEWTSTTLGLRG